MERRLAAILAADVVGYSRMMADDEVGTYERLTELRSKIVEPLIAGQHGRVVKLVGDGLLAEFPSVIDAVECAIGIQAATEKNNLGLPDEHHIRLRIGVNIGDLIIESDDIYGEGVNVASRLEPLAEPGGICVSREVYEYTHGKVSKDFVEAGLRHVKNIPEPIMVYRIADKGDTSSGTGAPRRRLGIRHVALGAAALAVLAGGLLSWQLFQKPPSGEEPAQESVAAAEQPSLVVLPFENLDATEKDNYFADGLTSDLITDLSKISGLLVISRNTAFSYKDRPVDTRAVARELGVRYVLEGSVRRMAGQVRVNAQLIDSRTGESLWADRVDRRSEDMFAVQDEVIDHIVDSLAVQLSPTELQRVKQLPTHDLEAYDNYLRAEDAARSGLRPRLKEALQLYDKATSLDPSFARAYAAQARVEAFVMRQDYDDILAFPIARKLAYEHAGRALRLDPEAALPFAVLAELQTVDGRYEQALESARQAVTMAPGEAEAHVALGFVHTFGGRHKEAIVEFETALKLNPRLRTNARQVAAMSYILEGKAQRAVDVLEAVRDVSSGLDDYQAILAAAYEEAGQKDLARKAAEDANRVGPNASVELYRVNMAHFRRSEDLEHILDAMTRAGVQKWPFAFRPGSRKALSGEEIEQIAIGRSWSGNLDGVGPGFLQISTEGVLAIRTATLFATGKAFVSGDRLCVQYQALSLARAVCGQVYRAPEPSAGTRYAYTYVNGNMVFNFTPRN